jgi:hypothetical protein
VFTSAGWRIDRARAPVYEVFMSEPLQPLEPAKPDRPAVVGDAINRVQQAPAKSIASAFVIGFLLSVFPVGRIVSFLIGLALTLARPVLLVLGGFKVWEEMERRRK